MSHLTLVTNPPATPYPEAIHQLDRHFHAELAVFMAIRQAHAEAYANAKAIGLSTAVPEITRDAFDNLWDTINRRAVEIAQASLSEQGLPVDLQRVNEWIKKIHHYKIRDVLRESDNVQDLLLKAIHRHYQQVNPFQIWDYMASIYTPEAIRNQAMQKAALRFISTFGLRRSHEIKSTGRHVILTTRVWTDVKWNSTRRELHYNAREEFHLIAEAFRTLQQTADLPADVYDLAGLATTYDSFGQHGFSYQSREKYEFKGDIVLTLYNTEFKLQLPHPLAAAINLMIAEYGDLHQ